jgi:NAD(P)-dependent dehydrogenase (short-subunit alcohol dehydrogenase family)
MTVTRVAIVTGGTGALGRAVVRHFLDAGYRVWLPWLSQAEFESLERDSGKGQVKGRRVSLSDEPAVKGFFSEVDSVDGRIDVLANIAGGFAAAPIEETDVVAWHHMIDLNATTAFLCCRYAAPIMKRQRAGRVINVASGPAVNRGAAGMAAYAASKAAVLNLTESLAKEFGPHGITANALVPTVIDTPANRNAMPNADTSTWLRPEEIAAVVGLLAGDAAGVVTGTAVMLSKG